MELSEYKSKVKQLGYKIKVSTYSEFKGVEYRDSENNKVPTSVMTRQDVERHAPLHNLRQSHKGQVFDAHYRVVI